MGQAGFVNSPWNSELPTAMESDVPASSEGLPFCFSSSTASCQRYILYFVAVCTGARTKFRLSSRLTTSKSALMARYGRRNSNYLVFRSNSCAQFCDIRGCDTANEIFAWPIFAIGSEELGLLPMVNQTRIPPVCKLLNSAYCPCGLCVMEPWELVEIPDPVLWTVLSSDLQIFSEVSYLACFLCTFGNGI